MSKQPLRPYNPLNIPLYDTFFRAVNAPGADPLDPDYVCVRFNEDWLPYVLGALARLEFEDTWKGDEAAKEQAIGHARNLIAIFAAADKSGCFEGVDDMRLRQKPGEPCVLQASYDGGDSWSDVFDYAACFEEVNKDLRDLTYIEQYNNYQQTMYDIRNVYDGTPDSVATESADGTIDDPNNLDLAICLAVRVLVDGACESAIQIKEQEEEQQDNIINVAASGFAIAGLIAATFVFPPAGLAAAGAFATYGLFGVGLVAAALPISAILNTADVAIFTNEDAKKEVVCCMNTALAGAQPTEATFKASLDSCGTLSTSGEELRTIIREIIQDTDLYLQFLLAMDSAYASSQTGNPAIPPCPCDEWTIEQLNGNGTEHLTLIPWVGYGTLPECTASIVGNEIIGCDNGVQDGRYTTSLGVEIAPGAAFNLESLSLTGIANDNLNLSNPNDMITVILYDQSGSQIDYLFARGDQTGITINTAYENVWRIEIFMRSYGSGGYTDCKMSSLSLTGSGANPFT